MLKLSRLTLMPASVQAPSTPWTSGAHRDAELEWQHYDASKLRFNERMFGSPGRICAGVSPKSCDRAHQHASALHRMRGPQVILSVHLSTSSSGVAAPEVAGAAGQNRDDAGRAYGGGGRAENFETRSSCE
ncbi:hypothetical protein B0H12DRAFT_275582 [Mycena haematopus]|nr:hypothetical protein B0H12DRAFT_275582 [Mycena haematopus]